MDSPVENETDFSKVESPFEPWPSLFAHTPFRSDPAEAFSLAATRRLGYVLDKRRVRFFNSYHSFFAQLVTKWKTHFPCASILTIAGAPVGLFGLEFDSIRVPFNETTGWMCLEGLKKRLGKRTNDLIFLSNPLFPYGTLPKQNELQGFASLVYERGAFVLWDEGLSNTCRLSATASPFPSPAASTFDRMILLSSLSAKEYVDETLNVVVSLIGSHPNLDFLLDLQNDKNDSLPILASAYSITYLSISFDRGYQISRVLHGLRLYAYRVLKPLTKTICLAQGGWSLMVPFPAFKLEHAAKLGLRLVNPQDFSIHGYLPLFLNDFDGEKVLKEAPSPLIYKPKVLEAWVKLWTPKIYEGLEKLKLLLTTT